MKKQFYTILFICTTITVFSQQTSSLKFGIKAGIAFSKSNIEVIDTSYSFSSSGKTGIIFGVYLNMPIGSKVYFQPNLLYVRKGYKQTLMSYGDSYNEPISYLEIPLNLLYTLPSKINKYSIGAGVSPAFKLNSYYSGDEIKDVDIGLNITGGLIIPIGFSFNLNYTHGLQNVSKNKNYFRKIQNSYLGLVVGYEF